MLTMLRVMAVAQIIQGCLELLAAVLCAFAAIAPSSVELEERLADNPMAAQMPRIVGILAVMFLVLGGLRITGGLLNWDFRGYGLSMATGIAGVVTILTCYCFPTALCVLILVLVTLLNGRVREAFQRRAGGERAREIAAWLG